MAKNTLKSIGLLVLPLLLNTSLTAQTVTDPVGVVKIEIAAATSPTQHTFSFLSTSMSQEVAYQGVVDSGSTGTITIGSDDWTVNQFSGVPHYAIVASGAREGEILDIASNTVNTLTLSGGAASESQTDLAGETIRIHKHNTIASIFGANPTVGTVEKGSLSTADQVLLFDPSLGTYRVYFYNKDPDPFDPSIIVGWVVSTDLTTDASNTAIYPDDGFVYKRLPQTSFTISVSGTVLVSKIKVPLTNGYNLITVPYPVDKNKTLANSGLMPADIVDHDINIHLKHGSLSTADQILIFTNGNFDTYFYNKDPDPFDANIKTGWVKTTDLTQNADSTVLPAGAGFFILRRTGSPALNWNFDSVTTN